jgi:hypothetical protein
VIYRLVSGRYNNAFKINYYKEYIIKLKKEYILFLKIKKFT